MYASAEYFNKKTRKSFANSKKYCATCEGAVQYLNIVSNSFQNLENGLQQHCVQAETGIDFIQYKACQRVEQLYLVSKNDVIKIGDLKNSISC